MDLCKNPLAPLACARGCQLASWVIELTASKRRIYYYFSNGIGNSTSVGHSSMHTLENHLRYLDPYSLFMPWLQGHVEHSLRTLPFFYWNILDSVWYLLHPLAYPDDLVYALCGAYLHSGHRIYAERHKAEWWWDFQVLQRSLFCVKGY